MCYPGNPPGAFWMSSPHTIIQTHLYLLGNLPIKMDIKIPIWKMQTAVHQDPNRQSQHYRYQDSNLGIVNFSVSKRVLMNDKITHATAQISERVVMIILW